MIGFPLVLKCLVNDLSLNFDRWCVTALFGLFAFGQYAFAMLLVSAGLIIHNAIWCHVGPHAAHSFGRDGNIKSFLHSLHRLSIAIVILFLLAWVPFNYAVNHFVPWYFPEYPDAAKLLPIFYWGVLFQILSQYDWIPMVLKRTSLLLLITLVCAIITGLLYGAGLLLSWSMLAFAWVFVVGRGLNVAGQLLIALTITARVHNPKATRSSHTTC